MKRVLKTPVAEADLEEIGIYIAQDDPDASDRLLDAIADKLALLAESPGIGRAREELAPGLRSFPVSSYVVFYRSIDDGIDVIRVLHAARDIPAVLGSDES